MRQFMRQSSDTNEKLILVKQALNCFFKNFTFLILRLKIKNTKRLTKIFKAK